MPSKKSARAQAQKTKKNLRKLKSLGLVDKVDLRKAPSAANKRALKKYADVLSGKAAVVTADKKTAAKYKKIFGTKGNKIIVPRRSGEKVTITKDGTIKTTRRAYGEKITKTIGQKVEKAELVEGERTFYTLPIARGKKKLERRRFSSFDEMLFYMRAYEFKFEDWEKYIEVESVATDSKKYKSYMKEVSASKQASARRKKAKGKKRRGKKK